MFPIECEVFDKFPRLSPSACRALILLASFHPQQMGLHDQDIFQKYHLQFTLACVLGGNGNVSPQLGDTPLRYAQVKFEPAWKRGLDFILKKCQQVSVEVHWVSHC